MHPLEEGDGSSLSFDLDAIFENNLGCLKRYEWRTRQFPLTRNHSPASFENLESQGSGYQQILHVIEIKADESREKLALLLLGLLIKQDGLLQAKNKNL